MAASNECLPEQLLSGLEITDLTVNGGAVARHEGRVVFLDAGLPGDCVTARVLAVEKRVVRAGLEAIERPSAHRQPSWCPHFTDCGACTWQDLQPERLLDWKREHVRQTLRRLGGGEEIPVAPVLASPLQRGYRNKMAFAFAVDGQGKTVLGLRKRNSHEVVEVTGCSLLPEPAMAIVAHVRRRSEELGLGSWNGQGQEGEALRFLVLHMPSYTSAPGQTQIIVECICGPTSGGRRGRTAEALQSLGRELMDGFGVSGFIHTERRQRAPVAQGEKLVASLGKTICQEQYHHLLLETPYDCFMQTNTGAAEALYAQIAAYAGLTGSEVLWDIYCGAGGIGLYMARLAREVYGFDIQEAAIRAARENALRLGFSHCRFQAGDLRLTLAEAAVPPDVVVLDPPRSGLDAGVVDRVKRLPARSIVYVSCDVGTQARDMAKLREAWQPVEASPVDMFPHTPHVENIVLFTRRR